MLLRPSCASHMVVSSSCPLPIQSSPCSRAKGGLKPDGGVKVNELLRRRVGEGENTVTNSVRRQATSFQRGRRLSNRHEGRVLRQHDSCGTFFAKLLCLIIVVTSVTWSLLVHYCSQSSPNSSFSPLRPCHGKGTKHSHGGRARSVLVCD